MATRQHNPDPLHDRLTDYFSMRDLVWALFFGALISGTGFAIDHLIHNADRLLASDFYTLLVAFGFSYVLLAIAARRRAVLTRRMQIAAEVNHHIRNALTGVVFTAAVRNDPALEAVLVDATARIDWVLTTVLPDGANELRWPVQSSDWQPAPWTGTKASTESNGPTLLQ